MASAGLCDGAEAGKSKLFREQRDSFQYASRAEYDDGTIFDQTWLKLFDHKMLVFACEASIEPQC